MEPQQPVMQKPSATQEPMMSGKKPGKSKKKLLGIVGAVVAVVLLVGGAGAALYVNAQYNKPENVLASALSKYALADGPRKFEVITEVKDDTEGEAPLTVEASALVQMAGKGAQVDLDVNVAVFRLRGSVQANENGNLYVKVKDLGSLLGLASSSSTLTIPEELKAKIVELDDKWIEITKEDLAEFTGQAQGESALDKCTNKVYEVLADKEFGDRVDGLYKNHRFFEAKSSSEEVVEGRKLLKVEVGIDQTKLDSFDQQLQTTEQFKALAEACGDGVESAESATDSVAGTETEVRNGKTYAWLDRSKKELVMMEMTGEGYENDKKSWTGSLKLKAMDATGVKLDEPSEVINIKELMTAFGIDPATLSGGGSVL